MSRAAIIDLSAWPGEAAKAGLVDEESDFCLPALHFALLFRHIVH